MTDRMSGQHRPTSSRKNVLRWVNTDVGAVPAYGVVQLKDNFASGYSQASKPSSGSGLFFANGPVPVGSLGESLLWNYPQRVLLDGSPTVGDEVGPSEDSWSMSAGGTGFRVIHQPVGGVGSVVMTGGGGSTANLVHGIIHAVLGCGYYEVELATWDGLTPDTESTSGSVAVGCDICQLVTDQTSGSGSNANCTETATLPVFEEMTASDEIVTRQVTGTGTVVLAFDHASRFIPLELWSDCLMADVGDENALGSTSDSSGTNEPVYQIVRGHKTHTIQYVERWECCNGTDTLVGRTPIIFEAKVCAEEICDSCA